MTTDQSTFTCPLCGSSFFNTYGTTVRGLHGPQDTLHGRCKGPSIPNSYTGDRKRGYAGCKFTWPRTEDAKYFSPKKTDERP